MLSNKVTAVAQCSSHCALSRSMITQEKKEPTDDTSKDVYSLLD